LLAGRPKNLQGGFSASREPTVFVVTAAALVAQLADESLLGKVQRDATQDRLFVAPPFRSAANGGWVSAASRRLTNDDGSFAGVLTAAIKQRGVSQTCFGVEAPGSGRTIDPETGKTCDDLVPVISAMDWLTDEDKRKIFHDNPAKVCPALAKA